MVLFKFKFRFEFGFEFEMFEFESRRIELGDNYLIYVHAYLSFLDDFVWPNEKKIVVGSALVESFYFKAFDLIKYL